MDISNSFYQKWLKSRKCYIKVVNFMINKNVQIDKCIYCGGIGETDEHVIPSALGGRIVLRRASCEKCRDVTSRCERNPLNENWAQARAALDYPSRRRNFDNETFPLNVFLQNGVNTILNLNKSEMIGFTPFLEYPLPAFFGNTDYKNGVIVSGHCLIGFGPDYKILVKKYGIKSIKYTVKHKGNDFEKMIVKIAYCFVVWAWGLDCFKNCFILETILGLKDDVGFWMGCDPDGQVVPLIGKKSGSNVIKIGLWKKSTDDNRYIVVRLKFFATSDAPEYLVVVGTLKPDFVPSNI
jgi:hypothetical protein